MLCRPIAPIVQDSTMPSLNPTIEYDKSVLDRVFTLELARVAEAAAVAAARWRGRGNEKQADQAAVDAMRTGLNALHIRGRVVIGEGERDEAPMLYIGEEVGRGDGPEVDIALDPLEGTTLCAKNMPNSLAVIAIAQRGMLLNAPDVYMQKIAVGPGYPKGILDLDVPADQMVYRLAEVKGVDPSEFAVCILDRERHAEIIDLVRSTGASIQLLTDGDVAGIIATTDPTQTNVDLYIGTGGAPEGVLASAALRCTGGQMLGRLILDSDEKVERARKMGIEDPFKVFTHEEMARGDVLFAAAGVTDGAMLTGVKFTKQFIQTETLVMRSSTGTVREIKARHQDFSKFA
jgi:fructose-1,6-bisphosphatase II / sedoheptulose-1,7-bisphosphatase